MPEHTTDYVITFGSNVEPFNIGFTVQVVSDTAVNILNRQCMVHQELDAQRHQTANGFEYFTLTSKTGDPTVNGVLLVKAPMKAVGTFANTVDASVSGVWGADSGT